MDARGDHKVSIDGTSGSAATVGDLTSSNKDKAVLMAYETTLSRSSGDVFVALDVRGGDQPGGPRVRHLDEQRGSTARRRSVPRQKPLSRTPSFTG
jgi:hypothetical protein